MKDSTMFILFIIAVLVVAGAVIYNNQTDSAGIVTEKVKKFASITELQDFIKTNSQMAPYYGGLLQEARTSDISATGSLASESASKSSDYSTTNIQVEGVDEADIVKNDGEFIYLVSNNKVYIIKAYPSNSLEILSEINFSGSVSEIYINQDKLIIFGYEYQNYYSSLEKVGIGIMPPIYRTPNSFIKVYDISDRKNPEIARDVSVTGNYYSSRMIDNYVYVIVNQQVYSGNLNLPLIKENGIDISVRAPEIYYFDYPDYSYTFTNILSIDVENDNKAIEKEVFLTSYTQNMYVSNENIYLTYSKRLKQDYYFDKLIDEVYLPAVPSDIQADITKVKNSNKQNYEKIQEVLEVIIDYSKTLDSEKQSALAKEIESRTNDLQEEIWKESQKTIVHKISIKDGKIRYESEGEVSGQPLNQFSMDEYNGNFRIATTINANWMSSDNSKNNLYVLNKDLEVIGKLENLAEGERIYSTRFIGDRAYMVTFRQVDPLFVIDLKNPRVPEVLGQLKITGFSSYLHPYDENHIIGIGQEADANSGRTQGLKLALFDVSDVSNPIEISKYTFPAQSYSEAMYNHKAFLFSKDKNLLVIPVTIYDYDSMIRSDTIFIDNSFYGAYVFDISLNGITEKGKISHEANKTYRWSSGISRSLYIKETLYTISQLMVQANSLETLEKTGSVELPNEDVYPILYKETVAVQ